MELTLLMWNMGLTLVILWQSAHALSLGGRQQKRDLTLVELETEMGKVVGRKETVLGKELDIFLGIPYAEPPVGDRRFRRPEMIKPWNEPKIATRLPNSCHQMIDTSFDQFAGVDMWNPNTNLSEDCLYLNIWAPSQRLYGEARAVMFWIFGGSFTLGSSTLDIYNGRILAAQGDVIVVSIQYRVGPLGFLFLNDIEAPGNMGLLDQHMALRWVYDNIEAFGGDRDRITVFGESAGAASTSYHLLSPLSQPFMRAAILQSGSALAPWASASNRTGLERSLSLATRVSCNRKAPTSQLVHCLRKVSAQKLSEEIWSIPDELTNIIAPISPIVDGYFIQDTPKNILNKGEFKSTDILLGVNKDEGYYFLVYSYQKYFNISYPNRVLSKEEYHWTIADVLKLKPESVKDAVAFEYGITHNWDHQLKYKEVMDDLVGDYCFKCPVIDFAHAYAKRNHDVYLYNFVHRTSANPWPEWLGTLHGYEIDHVFGAPLNTSRPYAKEETELSSQMIQYWTNFAKTR